MDPEDFAEQVSGVATLAEPLRRELYQYVVSQAEPVSREQACEGLEVAHHTAKFHLDRLVAAGLLDVEYRRLSGRRGPGAGRPTKLYRRSGCELAISVPERRYDLAAHLLAQAVEAAEATGTGVVDALQTAAREQGVVIANAATALAGARPTRERVVAGTCAALALHGYEPRRDGDTITLSNCPFLALAQAHPDLVCGMNLTLLSAAAAHVGGNRLHARLESAEGRCCVVLDAR